MCKVGKVLKINCLLFEQYSYQVYRGVPFCELVYTPSVCTPTYAIANHKRIFTIRVVRRNFRIYACTSLNTRGYGYEYRRSLFIAGVIRINFIIS